MKTYVKIIIVVVSGGLVWGLAYCGTLLPNYAMAFSMFAGGVAAICTSITGFTGQPKV